MKKISKLFMSLTIALMVFLNNSPMIVKATEEIQEPEVVEIEEVVEEEAVEEEVEETETEEEIVEEVEEIEVVEEETEEENTLTVFTDTAVTKADVTTVVEGFLTGEYAPLFENPEDYHYSKVTEFYGAYAALDDFYKALSTEVAYELTSSEITTYNGLLAEAIAKAEEAITSTSQIDYTEFNDIYYFVINVKTWPFSDGSYLVMPDANYDNLVNLFEQEQYCADSVDDETYFAMCPYASQENLDAFVVELQNAYAALTPASYVTAVDNGVSVVVVYPTELGHLFDGVLITMYNHTSTGDHIITDVNALKTISPNFVIYDIELTLNGNSIGHVNFETYVRVTVDLPSDYPLDINQLRLHHVNEGVLNEMEILAVGNFIEYPVVTPGEEKVVGTYLEFETNHFSRFAVSLPQEQIAPPTNNNNNSNIVNTGVRNTVLPLCGVILLAGVVIAKQIRKEEEPTA